MPEEHCAPSNATHDDAHHPQPPREAQSSHVVSVGQPVFGTKGSGPPQADPATARNKPTALRRSAGTNVAAEGGRRRDEGGRGMVPQRSNDRARVSPTKWTHVGCAD